jgi:ribonuclease E
MDESTDASETASAGASRAEVVTEAAAVAPRDELAVGDPGAGAGAPRRRPPRVAGADAAPPALGPAPGAADADNPAPPPSSNRRSARRGGRRGPASEDATAEALVSERQTAEGPTTKTTGGAAPFEATLGDGPAISPTGDQAARRPKIGDTRPAPVRGAVPTPPALPATPPGRRGRARAEERAKEERAKEELEADDEGKGRRRRRGGKPKPAGERRPVEAVLVEEHTLVDDDSAERRRGKERKGRPVGRYLMVVHVQPQATQIAVLEGRSLIEHYVSRPADDATQIDGNIYLGRVQNVLPGMEAAFIDIGTPKNAVLYRGDLHLDSEEIEAPAPADGAKPTRGHLRGAAKDARIEQLLKAGQQVVCQVTKNPIGTKGARLTQEVSLPGRFVVLIPNSDTYGISKRLPDDERKRLRRILDDVRPAGHGLIVRTAAEGATAEELRRDVGRLQRQWEQIDGLAKSSRAPRLLYREPDMAVRVIREEFNREYRGVIIDDARLFEEVRDYVGSISPELADRVEYADPAADPLPVFERHHVHEQIHKALDRKVWLPSGGSLIIERTEALTVIDVNTGKNVGTSNLEETVFRNNLEAADEIARQLRLRDIGGIIVIDFIDMEIAANRNEVIRTFREALARDKTRTQVFDISELGLVEMTRKRISEGLVESFSQTCPTCAGRGIVFDESLLSP